MMQAAMKLPVYLDYSATTPVDPRVVDKLIPYLRESFGIGTTRARRIMETWEEVRR